MNSMILIGTPILRRTCLATLVLTLAFDASAARGSDDCRVEGAGRQDHPIARAQIDPRPLALEHKSDRAFYAVQDLLVRVTVRHVPLMRTVPPRVARPRLPPYGRHHVVHRRHPPFLRLGR